jgi:hypothetical protein
MTLVRKGNCNHTTATIERDGRCSGEMSERGESMARVSKHRGGGQLSVAPPAGAPLSHASGSPKSRLLCGADALTLGINSKIDSLQKVRKWASPAAFGPSVISSVATIRIEAMLLTPCRSVTSAAAGWLCRQSVRTGGATGCRKWCTSVSPSTGDEGHKSENAGSGSRASRASQWRLGQLVDLRRYPIGTAGFALRCRAQLEAEGVVLLPAFLKTEVRTVGACISTCPPLAPAMPIEQSAYGQIGRARCDGTHLQRSD